MLIEVLTTLAMQAPNIPVENREVAFSTPPVTQDAPVHSSPDHADELFSNIKGTISLRTGKSKVVVNKPSKDRCVFFKCDTGKLRVEVKDKDGNTIVNQVVDKGDSLLVGVPKKGSCKITGASNDNTTGSWTPS